MKIIIDDQYYDEDDSIQVNINNKGENKQEYKNIGFLDVHEDFSNEFDSFFGEEDYYNQDKQKFEFNTEMNKFDEEIIQGPTQEEMNEDFEAYYNKIPHTKDFNNLATENVYKHKNKSFEEKGRIIVYSKLGDRNGIEIRGAKINLYELNGVTPKLCQSLLTDVEGKVVFDNLEDGCYRVVAIVDRRYFEKPKYITWNEVIINNTTKDSTIYVVNVIKNGVRR